MEKNYVSKMEIEEIKQDLLTVISGYISLDKIELILRYDKTTRKNRLIYCCETSSNFDLNILEMIIRCHFRSHKTFVYSSLFEYESCYYNMVFSIIRMKCIDRLLPIELNFM